jgi:hypothetical protein
MLRPLEDPSEAVGDDPIALLFHYIKSTLHLR